MAGKLPPEAKQKLLDVGKWKEFCEKRKMLQDLVSRQAMTPKDRDGILARDYGQWIGVEHEAKVVVQETGPENRPAPDAGLDSAGATTQAPSDISADEPPKPSKSKKPGKGVNPRLAVQWIFQNMGNKQVREEDAPDPGTFTWLKRLQSNVELQDEFYRHTYSKLLPSKAQLDREEVNLDETAGVLELIERVSKEMFKKDDLSARSS